MYKPKNNQERILHRLKIARGHLDQVIRMVEDQKYCIDIIHQSQAVQSALKEVDTITLENHLKTCVVDHIKNGESEKSVEEIMKVFKKNK